MLSFVTTIIMIIIISILIYLIYKNSYTIYLPLYTKYSILKEKKIDNITEYIKYNQRISELNELIPKEYEKNKLLIIEKNKIEDDLMIQSKQIKTLNKQISDLKETIIDTKKAKVKKIDFFKTILILYMGVVFKDDLTKVLTPLNILFPKIFILLGFKDLIMNKK